MSSWLGSSSGPNLQRSDWLERSSTIDSTIPNQLQAAIPECARPCVSNWITTQYSQACRDSCLCNTYSDDSYALGEIALICAMSENCAGAVNDETADSAYAVCSPEPDAVPGTHTTLTATVYGMPQSASSRPSQTTSPASQTASMTLTSSHAISSTLATVTSTLTSGATSTSAAETASGATTSKSPLTGGQAIGVSIGAVAGVVIVVCIVYLLACMRRRKAKREHTNRQSYDFVDEGSTAYSQLGYGSENPHGPRHSDHLQPKMGTELPIPKHNTVWPSQHYQPQHFVASTDDERVKMLREVRSNVGMRAVSQLLPERPGSKPHPPPWMMSTSPQLIQTPATAFEEDRTSTLPHVLLPGLPAHPAVLKTRQPWSYGTPQPALTLETPGQHPHVADVE